MVSLSRGSHVADIHLLDELIHVNEPDAAVEHLVKHTLHLAEVHEGRARGALHINGELVVVELVLNIRDGSVKADVFGGLVNAGERSGFFLGLGGEGLEVGGVRAANNATLDSLSSVVGL